METLICWTATEAGAQVAVLALCPLKAISYLFLIDILIATFMSYSLSYERRL
jgi:hypothetical protein